MIIISILIAAYYMFRAIHPPKQPDIKVLYKGKEYICNIQNGDFGKIKIHVRTENEYLGYEELKNGFYGYYPLDKFLLDAIKHVIFTKKAIKEEKEEFDNEYGQIYKRIWKTIQKNIKTLSINDLNNIFHN